MSNPRVTSSRTLAFVLVVSEFSTSSCLWQKKPQVFTPPAPQAQPPKPSTGTPTLPAPPEIAGDPNATLPATPNGVPEAPAPPAPQPPTRKETATPPPRVATPTIPPTGQPTPPRLGPMLTPDQLRDFNRNLDESLDRVKKALAILSKRNLNPEQAETANRISTFQKQAEQAREQDLVTAVNLAHRADLLAQDLLDRIPQ